MTKNSFEYKNKPWLKSHKALGSVVFTYNQHAECQGFNPPRAYAIILSKDHFFSDFSQKTNHGVLYVSPIDSEWFSGSVALTYTFEKIEGSAAAFDFIERSAASVELPIDPLDEDER